MRRGIAAAAALAVATTPVTPAAAGPPLLHGPDGVAIEIATVHDSGCPIGTVRAALRNGADAFAVIYSEYMAQAGGLSDPWAFRKRCQIALKVHVPQGFTYAVSSTDHHGLASLEEGATATYKATHFFTGQPRPDMTAHHLHGPYDDEWTFTDRPPPDQLAFKPCDENPNLNLYTEARVDKGTSDPSKTSFIAIAAEAHTTYHFTWKRCP
ncbi:DUF4360 domain-containing protein [Actinomadura sp. KC06]|uniref:DUF4360 domain-containing protein n=1 Tax=Actinomadura sp. KC06 TaxID=2530369 RepID=UPI00104E9A41|nr:DUF4360 domain-containing protein [Actinomadura sp. KC06]TDD32108.1 DUF4360 domain-containing protein [Actinomadura sp. KC06]